MSDNVPKLSKKKKYKILNKSKLFELEEQLAVIKACCTTVVNRDRDICNTLELMLKQYPHELKDLKLSTALKLENMIKSRHTTGNTRKKKKDLLVPGKLSETLKSFLNTETDMLSAMEVSKLLIDYIRAKKLQNPADRRSFIPDEELSKLFYIKYNSEVLNYKHISKYISPHVSYGIAD